MHGVRLFGVSVRLFGGGVALALKLGDAGFEAGGFLMIVSRFLFLPDRGILPLTHP